MLAGMVLEFLSFLLKSFRAFQKSESAYKVMGDHVDCISISYAADRLPLSTVVNRNEFN